MNWWLAIAGIVLVLVLGGAGLLFGEVDRVLDDPEVKKEAERRKAEETRKQAWKVQAVSDMEDFYARAAIAFKIAFWGIIGLGLASLLLCASR